MVHMIEEPIKPLWTAAAKHRSLVSALACAAFFLAFLPLLPSQPETTQDSAGFLQFAADRTAAYPMFLALIGRLPGALSVLPVVQLAVLCGSTLLFSIAVDRLTGSLVCAVAALLLILGHYEVVKYCVRVMSDALFISLLAALLGCIMFSLATNRLGWMAAASAFLGAAIAVRPAGEALLVMLPILYARAWFLHDRRALTMGAMILPGAAMALLSLAAYHQRHDTWNPSSVWV